MRPGETIYKGHHSYDLMRNLQLGIIFSTAKSVEQAAAGGLKEPVKDEDFAQQVGCPLLSSCLCPWLLTERLPMQRWHSSWIAPCPQPDSSLTLLEHSPRIGATSSAVQIGAERFAETPMRAVHAMLDLLTASASACNVGMWSR